MYNTSVNLTYHDKEHYNNDTVYRKELLDVFSLQQFDLNQISELQNNLFNKFSSNKDFINIINIVNEKGNPWPIQLSDSEVFILMFSYDLFYLTHELIQSLLANNQVEKTIIIKFKEKFNNI